MGLDISVRADNDDLFEYQEDHFKLHSLSRTFCNMMCRQNVLEGGQEPELEQIGRLTGVDIAPIYEMLNYPEEQGLEFHLSVAENEEERQKILRQAEEEKANLAGNIDKVLATVEGLLSKLADVPNLPSLLDNYEYDTLYSPVYFSDFHLDRENGYIDNSFGQDLRNFRRFLEYAKSKGSTTVYFEFG